MRVGVSVAGSLLGVSVAGMAVSAGAGIAVGCRVGRRVGTALGRAVGSGLGLTTMVVNVGCTALGEGDGTRLAVIVLVGRVGIGLLVDVGCSWVRRSLPCTNKAPSPSISSSPSTIHSPRLFVGGAA